MNIVLRNNCIRIFKVLNFRGQSPSTGTQKRCINQTHRRYQESTSIRSRNAKEHGYALLIVPITTFCLGTWQVKRRKWKLNLIADLETRTTAPATAFPSDLDDLRDLEYRTVIVSGEFDHNKEIYVLPRAPVGDDTGGGIVGGGPGKSGAHVITPFRLTDRDLTILVNRGWVPRNELNPKTRPKGQVTGEVEIAGIVRKTEARKPFAAPNDPSRNRWFHRDVEAMAANVGAEPIFIDAVKESSVLGGPLGGQTRVTLRNEHLSYIFTWYTLSALTTAMWVRKYMR